MCRKLIYIYLVCFILALAGEAWADPNTVAYWRFDDQDIPDIDFSEGLATEVADGNILPDIDAQTGWESGNYRKAVHDWSDNGNHMTTWEWDWAGFLWDSNVPAATVPSTGADNTLSMEHLTGCCPACFTWSAQSSPSVDIEDIEPAQFTIEASFYMTEPATYRTIVGRDACGVDPENVNNAALYFQCRPNGVAGFLFCDVSGYFHTAFSNAGAIEEDKWYNMVAVSDGNTMLLYLDDVEEEEGFQLVAQTDMTESGSPDTALTNVKSADPNSGDDWTAGSWTVGRGMYNSGHTDRFFGYIDEVRISNTALKPSQFLFQQRASNPDPPDESETSTSVVLSWDPIPSATGHDVYFDTDETKVTDANRDNCEELMHCSLGQVDYTYLVSGLTPEQTYYWRIDEVNGVDVGPKGPVWSFTVTPLLASDPSPYNGEICVFYDPCTVLSWKPGVDANQSKLYFGTISGSLDLVTTIDHTGADSYSYDKTSLDPNTDYYWQVDEVNGPNNWPGDEWHFKTIPIISSPDPDLVGWWKFDEGQGKAIDWSGLDQHGTVYGGAAPIEGFDGDGISLDGEDDYVELPIGATISTLDNATVATWVNFEDSGTWWQRIFDFGISDSNGYMFLTPRGNPDGVFRFAISLTNYDGESVAAAPYALPTGWHHVAVVIEDNDPNIMRLYLDGADVNSSETLVLPSDLGNTTNNWLGRSQYAGDVYFSGSLDDFRIYKRALSQTEIKEIMASSITAWRPRPADGAGGVQLDPNLIWEPGKFADKHDVYFGTDEAAVTDANRDNQMNVLVKQNHDSNLYGPLDLEYETTYYWRIDEVNTATDPCFWPGDVWSFTTEPNIPITDSNLLGLWTFDEGEGSTAHDWSGHSNHGTIFGNPTWTTGMYLGALEFDGTGDYVSLPIGDEISSMNDCTIATWVNFSGAAGSFQRIFDFGNDTIEYMFLTPRYGWDDGPLRFAITLTSWDGNPGEYAVADPAGALPTGWHHVAVMIDSDDQTLTLYLDGSVVGETPAVPLTPGDLGVTVNNWLGRSQYAGDAYFNGSLDDFRIYNKVLTDEELRPLISPPWAWKPSPVDNATISVAPKPILTWMPGRYADKHDVYFGTDEAAVTDANRTNPLDVLVKQGQDPCSYDPCAVEFGQTYYWRIDEVNMTEDPTIWKGYVWSFTTVADYIEIDNFDRYSTRDDVRAVWKDGYDGLDNSSNITVSTAIDPRYPPGHEPPGPIHEGTNALQFVYDNDSFVCIYLPGELEKCDQRLYYYSEMQATIDALDAPSNWIEDGAKALSLQFYGDPCNSVIGDVNQMYVAIEDSNLHVSTVKYGSESDYEDMNDLKKPIWQQWNIDLQRFVKNNNNINLNDVNKVDIGFGVWGNVDTPGGYGIVYFDSIRLYLPRCIPERLAAGDLSGDCDFNLDDFVIMADGWRCEEESGPSDPNLIGQWKFDEASGTTASDSIGGNHGTVIGGAVLDGSGQLLLDGVDDYVDLPIGSVISTLDECSFAAWMDWSGGGGYQRIFDFGYPNEPNLADLNEVTEPNVYMYASTSWFRYAITIDGFDGEQVAQGTPDPMPSGQHFVVVTVDINDNNDNNTILSLYLDGRLAGYNADANLEPSDLDNTPNNWLGRSLYTTDDYYSGYYDEFRIYNRALSEVEVAQLYCSTLARERADLSGDGVVDFKDMAMMIDKWLQETLWP